MRLIKPETVTVVTHGRTYDDLGDLVADETTSTDVACVVVPGSTSELDAMRPNGVVVSYTVHFPKTWKASLRDAQVVVRGVAYQVVGDPQPYTDGNCPGDYDRPVEVTRTDG